MLSTRRCQEQAQEGRREEQQWSVRRLMLAVCTRPLKQQQAAEKASDKGSDAAGGLLTVSQREQIMTSYYCTSWFPLSLRPANLPQ